MMTYLWSGMILTGIVYAALTGNLQAVTEAVVVSPKEAVSLCLSVAGVTAMWTGLMKIAETTGLVAQLSNKLRPLLCFLFPDLAPDSKAARYISLIFLANILGLSWAGTSSGLMAFQELDKINREENHSMAASNAMCTFLIINVSSLQLIPVNLIAYRAQYGSVNPSAIVGPGIAATMVSTVVAVVFCKVMERMIRF